MTTLVVDVQYFGSRLDSFGNPDGENAHVAGILYTSDPEYYQYVNKEIAVLKTVVHGVEPYKAGEFYKKELPCIMALIEKYQLVVDTIIIDGLCHLPDGSPALGQHLFDAICKKYPVMDDVNIFGIAKNQFEGMSNDYLVYRKSSAKPLTITSSKNIEELYLDDFKEEIYKMKGGRIPPKIKRADTEARVFDSGIKV